VLVPQSGVRTLGHNVKAGYYSQYRVEMLRPERTVLEEGLDTPQRITEQFVRTLLGCFLFRGDDVFKRVSVLSGGEKSRLALVKLLLDPPNLLLMDEPTTHLDMSSIDALAYALDQFQGTLIFISHDVYFIRALANHVVHVNAGHLTHYPGGYQYYLDKTKAVSERAGLTAGSSSDQMQHQARSQKGQSRGDPPAGVTSTRKDQKRLEAEQRQVRSRERKAQQQRVHQLESDIHQLEARQAELIAQLEKPETYEKGGAAVAINRELLELQEQLTKLNPEWEKAATQLEQI
jgi:ATP-binding cassette subfamily F protein 3